MKTRRTQVAVVGAGPLGLELAVALKHAGIDYTQIEQGPIGNTMLWWAPQTRWFSSPERISIAGVPLITMAQEKATREEYLAYLRAVVTQFDLQIETFTRVLNIQKTRSGFTLMLQRTINGTPLGEPEPLHAEKIVLTTGGTERPNRLNVPGEDLPHVSHYLGEPHLYFGQRVLVVGGRNSAVEAALRCHRVGAQVTFSYRGSHVDAKDIKYWLYPEFSSLVKSAQIIGCFNTVVKNIAPRHATLAHGDGSTFDVPADFILLMTGYEADMSLLKMAGVNLIGEQQSPQFDEATMQTNVPGVFVAGTAIAGTQRRYRIFLENCHVHVPRIVAALKGRRSKARARNYDRPES